jgi:Ca2+-transporting ATPase
MSEISRGLSAVQVAASRAEHGSNVLTPPPRDPWWKLYLAKFDDPVIRILLVAAGVAVVAGAFDGHMTEGIGILIAVFLATFLAFWNEHRAGREFDVLNTTSDDVPVKVIREGGYQSIPRRDLVVGDCAFIETGEEIPADGTLQDAVGLQLNEAKLTGESEPVEKDAEKERQLFRGTTVVDGYGHYGITAVGDRTEIGKTLRESIVDFKHETPLKRQLAKLSKIIGVVGFGVATLTFIALIVHSLVIGEIKLQQGEWFFFASLLAGLIVILAPIWISLIGDALELVWRQSEFINRIRKISWLRFVGGGCVLASILLVIGTAWGLLPSHPSDWTTAENSRLILRDFMVAVTIIVVAVPEGLAMSVTLSLAYSMRRMTASHTLVRRMDACETIGAVTVICSDKTGTLTRNEMRVADTEFAGTPGRSLPFIPHLRQLVVEAFAVNSTAQLAREPGQPVAALGNPTEGALLLWLNEQGIDYLAIRNANPIRMQWTFNTERKFMATLGERLHVKGAPEVVLARCHHIVTESEPVELTPAIRDRLATVLRDYQSRGMRTLALAYGASEAEGVDAHSASLTLIGLIAIADPVRHDVPDAIAACRRAGVNVKIVTGDNAETAREVARQVGLGEGITAVTGPEFEAMSEEAAGIAAQQLTILARARPADKMRLVRLLKQHGHVVAVTGDGVNDGPALNFADVGLSMGNSGTAVAREASDIILLDDSFASVVNAMKWGRSLYENIQRFILFQLTINVVALGLAVIGPFLGFELPLTVLQMLWINLIMDTFAALALATEPPHESVLHKPPRNPQDFIVSARMAKAIFGVGSFFLAILVGMILYWSFNDQLHDDDKPSRIGTILFTTFVMLQFWNLFNAKAFGRGLVVRTLFNNPSFLLISGTILIGQVLIVQFGGTVFRTVPLTIGDWGLIIGMTSIVLWIGEVIRFGQILQNQRRKVNSQQDVVLPD